MKKLAVLLSILLALLLLIMSANACDVEEISTRTIWDVHWRTMTGEGLWGAEVGTSEFASTFDYDWGRGDVFGGYPDYIGFQAYAVINMQREVGSPVRFTVGGDDGVKLYIDGVEVIDDYSRHSYRTRSVTRTLTPGKHHLKLYYYEWTDVARVSFDCDSDVLEW